MRAAPRKWTVSEEGVEEEEPEEEEADEEETDKPMDVGDAPENGVVASPQAAVEAVYGVGAACNAANGGGAETPAEEAPKVHGTSSPPGTYTNKIKIRRFLAPYVSHRLLWWREAVATTFNYGDVCARLLGTVPPC